jgi:hypothetical protein
MPRPHTSSFVSQESGSAVLEIVRGSRLKAHNMVDVAVQVFTVLLSPFFCTCRQILNVFDSNSELKSFFNSAINDESGSTIP